MELESCVFQNQLLTRHAEVRTLPTTQVMAGPSISRVAAAAPAASLCAGHVQQLEGESPSANLMEVKA